MKIENVSKKIIGNQDFRLLPGETMEVAGDELWVKDYHAEKKLKAVAEEWTAKDNVSENEVGTSEADNEPDHADDENPAEESAEASSEGQDDEAKTTARGRKK